MSRPESWLAPPWAGTQVGALMSTRDGGESEGPFASMNLGRSVGDEPARVAVNRARFAAACGAAPVFLSQVHGTRVVRLGAGDACADAPVHEADASVTTTPGIACTVQVADCLPVLFAAPGRRGVAAAHAGWRGLAAGVPAAAIDALAHAFDSRPADLVVAIGPSISGERYEVGPEVRERFALGGFADEQLDRWFWRGSGDRFQFDGWSSAADQVAAAGVASSHIHVAALCTAEYPALFCSYRRDGAGAGRIAAAIRSAVVSSGRSRSGT